MCSSDLFASLRWGEAIALRRCDLDLGAGTISIRRQYVELATGHQLGPPKSRAGIRTLALPPPIIPAPAEHLDAYVPSEPEALIFAGPHGGIPRPGNFRRDSGWSAAVTILGIPGLHFHDLRHTGNVLAAQDGASLGDLKARMGHDSARAAMIYQHATTEADHKIAAALARRIEAAATRPANDTRPAR